MKQYRTRLTEMKVLEIYRMLESGSSYKEIAKKFNVTEVSIRSVESGKNFKKLYHRFSGRVKKLNSIDQLVLLKKQLQDFENKNSEIFNEYNRLYNHMMDVRQNAKSLERQRLLKNK